mgnify:FL=1|tara:strand:- start:4534 stop:4824 length:291 start_codon:yes stop_codon:yes gene_type:complete
MSRYAQFDEDGNQYQIASNLGWSEFGTWVESLDAKKYPALIELWNAGSTEDIVGLTNQLESALQDSAPSANVESSADLLLSGLQENQDSGIVLVTN